ncbi:MAG: acetyl-CoA carboxylase biotin carboxylase subunit [Methanothrix sp.]|uniref:acetyl-CoA carboxylase biotin carboxylase subunit n=1 Tax=Methanothrix sp. TaxID=90426 RepID=UPI003164F67D|nr:acetyl-CoA carboxylase biotin carboxylase subunit [Methanothrix sp.]
MFKKILVANRGEIAIRIMRACRELGVLSVAVYSDADKNALFAKYADEAVYIGPSPSSESYLNMDKIVKAALQTGAEAIHPGYGFLAENPAFAKLCEENGIVFIGPSSSSIDAMGSKITARQMMRDAGVPIVPGTEKGISDPEEIADIAERIGYPVIIKPAAGGGGIGMKIVDRPEDLAPAVASAQSIATSAFGDGTVYLEKYLTEPRHIEFQIMADNRGRTVYVSERECSIQRRHQKLIEEAPSPIMTPELRKRMGEIAVRAAKAIRYRSAGTVEFMYSHGDFYFLEMNTRLQVEHPITEMITGIDLAKEQISVAAGEDLSFSQNEIEIRGWAIECRINAEDPMNDFAPSPGRLKRYRSPGGPGIRVDSGVYTGYVIPPYYDSLISKLVAHGRDRNEAIARMERALYEYIIVGVTTNIPFHKAVLRNERFRRGEINTHFIREENILDDVKRIVAEEKEKRESLASALGADTRKIAAVSAAVGAYLSLYRSDEDEGEAKS